ncbi:hypothetical protein DLAC_00611 [Tieghemostelium lacteum]|uniref:Protein Abitram n=1 Tax=Tieghemostelium lacteum TaxID=361077 RepID=A0A152AA67_TIELA|nr:hypothetical protein DLAC_00611 [Tieghemostelium lacteum]|eukprot:KYR03116.1 hypothetical protein DLAC_00611 [Tieghemostelium lacteum]
MRTVIERYYTQLFIINCGGKEYEDFYINIHANELCIVGLAPTHPALKQTIKKITLRDNLLKSNVQGTKKRGGHSLFLDTNICEVTCTDQDQSQDHEFQIKNCLKGKLVELNKLLSSDPSLLQNYASTRGYLAIIETDEQPKADQSKGILTFEEYHTLRNLTITKGPVFQKDTEVGDDE